MQIKPIVCKRNTKYINKIFADPAHTHQSNFDSLDSNSIIFIYLLLISSHGTQLVSTFHINQVNYVSPAVFIQLSVISSLDIMFNFLVHWGLFIWAVKCISRKYDPLIIRRLLALENGIYIWMNKLNRSKSYLIFFFWKCLTINQIIFVTQFHIIHLLYLCNT